MTDIWRLFDQVSKLVQLGPVGILTLVVVLVLVITGAIAYAGYKGVWKWGADFLNIVNIREAEHKNWEAERKRVEEDRKRERDEWAERERDWAERERAQKEEARHWQSIAFITNHQLSQSDEQKRRLTVVVQEAVAVAKSATSGTEPPK